MNKFQPNFPLGKLTRFGVGGHARCFYCARSEAALITTVNQLKSNQRKFVVIGAGTNLVVSDDGLAMPVIQNKISGIARQDKNHLQVGAGVNLNYLVNYCNREGLAGLEKMAGIPGDLGGAIVGNAGAYGQEIKLVVRQVKIWDGKKITWLSSNVCRFDYRHSVFKRRRSWVILAAKLRLTAGTPTQLRQTSATIRRTRNAKYPPGIKCPGSYFKNVLLTRLPVAISRPLRTAFADKIKQDKLPAAALIEAVGLKGRQCGQIKIADYHANLLMNLGGGRARDVLALAALAKQMVYKRFGVQLEAEVRILDN